MGAKAGFLTRQVLLLCAIALTVVFHQTRASDTNRTVLIVVGAEGEAQYGERFLTAATNWQNAALAGSARVIIVGGNPGSTNELTEIHTILEREPKQSDDELWIVLIGHGTFDGKEAKFNLRGPDLSVNDLATTLRPFERPLILVNTASASGSFIQSLSGTNRIVVTATRSGNEQNYARFGEFMALAVSDPAADLDKDGQTSLLEAFLSASRKASEFYAAEGRLATEHALLDDNGDGRGTQADWFTGFRVTRKARDGAEPDGFRANQIHLVRNAQEQALSPDQRTRRDEIEREVETLRGRKKEMQEDDYYRDLEKMLLELGKIYGVSGGNP